ncbi:MAG: VCBS repeat-containing protein [Nisaea sp.]|uniref:FG-GAP repeat domain-containing protein n=1 Tax=Nisaea sp. TaxID=2024842 RepID=UPI001B0BFFE5|nr:VCBS repeat-containing protein [Nisaea sp.]MBO6559189.1 VCBS repeat-containing protein [Nisaea sp.]
MYRCLTCSAVLLLILSAPLSAAGLEIREVTLAEAGASLTVADGAVLVKTGDGSIYRLGEGGAIVAASGTAWPPADVALSPPVVRDGRIGSDATGRILAWYAEETEQYRHGALGDPVEALALVGREDDGKPAVYRMSGDEVFEDLEPRIVDLDIEPHGRPEIVTIVASAEEGAAIAVFGMARDADGDPALVRLATSSHIGSAFRWLNIAGIADFDGDGFTEIAYVDRPHIRGELVFLEWRGGRLREQERVGGFANHHGGSTVQDLSEIADVDGDGHLDLLLPDRGYRHFVAIGLDQEGAREIARTAIPSAPVSAVLPAGSAGAVYLDGEGRLFRLDWTR